MIKKNTIVPLSLGVIIGMVLILILVRSLANSANAEEFHEHANIAIFLDGAQLDLSSPLFMYFAPCSVNGESVDHSDFTNPVEVIHLHDNDGGTIHVHHPGLTYADFFEGIGMEITKDYFIDNTGQRFENNQTDNLQFYLNGNEISDISTTEVRDLDKVLITYNSSSINEIGIKEQLLSVPDTACLASGYCQHRGVTPEENCGSHAPKKSWIHNLLGI